MKLSYAYLSNYVAFLRKALISSLYLVKLGE